MGCAASASRMRHGNRPVDTPSSIRRGPSDSALDEFLPYYNFASLDGRDVFGPFLKLHSYDPLTGNYQLSALVVCNEAAQQRHRTHVNISWWELVVGQGESPPRPPPRRSGNGATPRRSGNGATPRRSGNGATPRRSGNGATPRRSGNGATPRRSGNGATPRRSGNGAPARGVSTLSVDEPQKSATLHSALGELLHSWREWRFWRFRFGTTCGPAPKQLRYQVGLMPGRFHTVAVPSLEDPWHLAFYSCNGLAEAGAYGRGGGLYALWHDLMRCHGARPFHVLIGGGDQLYNDGVFQGPHLRGWDQSQDAKDTAAKAAIPFSEEVRAEVEEFYCSHYLVHWSRPAFSEALASIPSVNSWDDHDIVDGWGSYPEIINTSAVMTGVFTASRLFYLLFQHHTTPERLTGDGYWCSPAACCLLPLGPSAALLVPDCRTSRTQHRVLPPGCLDEMAARLRALPPEVQHVVVLVGSPVLYPRLPVQEALQKLNDLATGDTLASIIMQNTGLAAQVHKRFGTLVYLDDLIDQWSASQHREERNSLLTALTELAAERGFRFTLLSGDVHCAGYGMLHGRHGLHECDVGNMPVPGPDALAADPRFIPQIISSAIINVPPPGPLLKLLCLTGRSPEPVLRDCVQRMIPLFGPEGDCTSMLHGRRNWCEIMLCDPAGNLVFTWHCEKELGSEEVKIFSVAVPPLRTLESSDGSKAGTP